MDKWDYMWNEFKAVGIEPTFLWDKENDIPAFNRDNGQPAPSLAILPIQKERRV